jgi:hypothetical protein
MIDEGTIREEYSDITLLKGDRMMAGAYVGYTLNLDEVVTRVGLGTVSEIQLTTFSVGPNQELTEPEE